MKNRDPDHRLDAGGSRSREGGTMKTASIRTELARILAGVLVAMAVLPDVGFAQSIDSARLVQQLRDAHYARVGIAGRTYVLVEPKVLSEGLAFEKVQGLERPAIITGAAWDSIATPPNPVPWSTLERIESGKRTRLPGALIGGGIGLVAGLLVGGFLGYVAEMEGNGDQTETMLWMTAASTGFGMAVGAAFPKTRWVQVHPEPKVTR